MAIKSQMNPPSLGQIGNTALVPVKGFHIKNHNIPLRALLDTDFKGVIWREICSLEHPDNTDPRN